MDEYTRRTRQWLEQIYTGPPPGFGEYRPHSPVHGFEPCARFLGTYAHVFFVLQHLARYEFRTCLDVGTGEGFLAGMIQRVFGAEVIGLDLAVAACRRAARINLPVVCGEAVHLPFADQSVDVAVSLNTLEHLPRVEPAFAELCRVARCLVILGLPHARRGEKKDSNQTPHGHLSLLSRREMQWVFGTSARLCGSLSYFARPFYPLAAEDDVRATERYAWLQRHPWRWPYALLRRAGSQLERRRALAWLCRIESFLSHLFPWWTYETVVVCSLPAARRRSRPFPARKILHELLSSKPLVQRG